MFLAPRRSIVDLKILILALGLVLFVLTGCSPLYVFQAAYEEGKILWRRQPIDRMLQRPDLDSDTREKLQLVLAVREYAQEPLKLRVRGSYASYSYVDRPTLSYVLMAAPKTDLRPYTWSFPLVGSFPYKGFFSKEAAEAEAERFQARGYDTYIRTSPAFSTLGWFDDPVLAHLLKYDKVTLAEVIFHELLHNTLFVKGQVSFNESLANFVGHQAAVLFFKEHYGEKSLEFERATRSKGDELEFSAFVEQVAESLKAVYARDLDDEEKLRLRHEVFSKSQQAWKVRIIARPEHRYRGYSEQNLNNAVIAHYLLYLRELELFDSLYQIEGKNLAQLVESIMESVQDSRDPFEAVRERLHKRQS
jgi:predicted aminopeptidase